MIIWIFAVRTIVTINVEIVELLNLIDWQTIVDGRKDMNAKKVNLTRHIKQESFKRIDNFRQCHE